VHGPLPDDRQRLLLTAALRRDEVARDAARAWNEQLDLDALDDASARLVPLLGSNLKRLGLDGAEARRIRGIQRYFWSQNQLHLRHCREVAQILARQEIPVIALKGIPLAVAYYDDVGLRPMSDIDLLVPTARTEAAVSALEAAGYSAKAGEEPHWRDGCIATSLEHGAGFVDGSGRECDLHWHMLNDCLGDEDDAAFWSRARSHEVHGFPVLFPSPEDLLLHVCAHGIRANAFPPIRWVADAAVLLRFPGLEWETFLAEAERRLLGPTLLLAFRTLDEILERDAVPPGVIERLSRLPAPWYARSEVRLRQRTVDYRYTPVGRLCELQRRHPTAGPLRLARTAPGFLMEIWNLDRLRKLPLEFGRRLLAPRPGGVRET
jgi:hypothetical protein